MIRLPDTTQAKRLALNYGAANRCVRNQQNRGDGNMRSICLLFVPVLFLANGCASYSKTGWYTPDGFNVTQYHAIGTPFKGDTIAWGFSWSLKDH